MYSLSCHLVVSEVAVEVYLPDADTTPGSLTGLCDAARRLRVTTRVKRTVLL